MPKHPSVILGSIRLQLEDVLQHESNDVNVVKLQRALALLEELDAATLAAQLEASVKARNL